MVTNLNIESIGSVLAFFGDNPEKCVVTSMDILFTQPEIYPHIFGSAGMVRNNSLSVCEVIQTPPLDIEVELSLNVNSDMMRELFMVENGIKYIPEKISKKKVEDCTIKDLLFATKYKLKSKDL